MTFGTFIGRVFFWALIIATCIGSYRFGRWVGFKAQETIDKELRKNIPPPPKPILMKPIAKPPQIKLKKDNKNKL